MPQPRAVGRRLLEPELLCGELETVLEHLESASRPTTEMLPWLRDLPGPQHGTTHRVRARVVWSVGRREQAEREFRLFWAKRRLARQARAEAA